MSATQQDIANKLNLSRSLVGGVLSNHPSLRASPETRARILSMAKELGYQPNAVASNLRSGKTGVVTFVYLSDSVAGGSTLIGGAMATLAANLARVNYSLHIRPFESLSLLLDGLRDLTSRSLCDAVVVWVEHGGEAAAVFLEFFNYFQNILFIFKWLA